LNERIRILRLCQCRAYLCVIEVSVCRQYLDIAGVVASVTQTREAHSLDAKHTISPGTLFHHLKILTELGLITSRKISAPSSGDQVSHAQNIAERR
jgi:hypothetical protein